MIAKTKKHRLPGEGGVDRHTAIAALNAVGYRGIWLYEAGYKAPDSMPRLRDLSSLDFIKNARYIFAHSGYTVPGDKIV